MTLFFVITTTQTGCVPNTNGRKTDVKNLININSVDIRNIKTKRPQLFMKNVHNYQ